MKASRTATGKREDRQPARCGRGEKDEDDQADDDDLLDQRVLERARSARWISSRAVVGRDDPHAFGQRRLDLLQALLDARR